MTTKTLIFVPEGGLCNRMVSINAARNLAADIGAHLRVLWILNDNCNCSFRKLFRPVDFEIRDVSEYQWAAFATKLKRKSRLAAKMLDLIEPLLSLRIVDSLSVEKWASDKQNIVQRIVGRRTVCLSSWFGFYAKCSYREFYPTEQLQSRIDNQSNWGDRYVVGVHVRRTDNVVAIESSPLDLYIERMNSYRSDVSFFLATDSPEVKAELKALFADRIITPDGELNRGSCGGMQQDVVELYSLARCRQLLASHWSSYSEAAADIGGIEMIKIKK